MNDLFEKFYDDDEQRLFGEDMRKYELYVIVPYIIPILFFLPVAVDKESEFCRFHANQSLCWLIVSSLFSAIGTILGMISPVMGAFGGAVALFVILCEAFLAVGAWKGYAIRIPVIGNMINLFK